ncbi:MAG: Ldh family oxidoreductase [Clostridium sp.]|jgi:LDH2 family malate/lactate/ureidoglycolate dehydrogenase|uniref:Ldh family oxidoreductase n=1 Tax=Clostridium sp. TaxID=1506 RepID=UPI0025C248C4|nr:Ldh family oxidoreductase [Clostridium sp.]MCH3964919.1 Ldh family oxidoreductase [Clostridium sp.]MCI1716587.1 Ldh family oxidoreductase [Clostridium sp.]MCI1800931.1 Ldh family oxidoreductase [Clostridium sp.]MCI1814764.1 Ldh family oxidoreductase [Clostridium sp.]MCI1871678.1 Ldh family oxidoreductase [Clostridium sp.]
MSYTRVRYDGLKKMCDLVFEKFGFSTEDSRTITDVLLLSDLFGIESHGIQRLVKYYSEIKQGLIIVDSKPKIIKETPVSATLDGQAGMGQLTGRTAMNMAIEKAEASGIGMVSVRNSNHYGIAGYYARMAEKKGLIGISMTNSPAVIVPTFGKEAMLGTNPIAISMPADPYPFLMDMATSVVTRGKVEVYNKRNEPLPDGWALDADGHDTTNPKDILYNVPRHLGGGIVPLGGSKELTGGHKGYGFALTVEMFTAILSGGLTGNYVHLDGKNGSGTCHYFCAIDYGMFGDKKSIENSFSKYLEELRNSKKAKDAVRIYTHGEKEVEAYNDKMKNGIPVNDSTLHEIYDICRYFDIDPENYVEKLN